MRGHHHARAGLGTLILTALVLSACTGAEEGPDGSGEPTGDARPPTGSAPSSADHPDAASASAPEPDPPPPEPSWTYDGTILSNPVEHEGDLLLHVDPEGGDRIALVSLDAATGEENWLQPVGHTGLFTAGPPTVRDDLVYAYEDTGEEDQAVAVALDASTGEEVARSQEEFRGYQMPKACGETEVCLSYRLPGAEQVSFGYLTREGDVLRLVEGNPVTSDAEEEPDPTSGEEPQQGEEDLPEVEVEVERDWETGEEQIQGWRGEEVVWSVSVDEAGVRADPEDTGIVGWSQAVGGVYVHDTFYGQELPGYEDQAFPLEEHVLLALDREDGSELWRRKRASLCATVGPEAPVVVVCSGRVSCAATVSRPIRSRPTRWT